MAKREKIVVIGSFLSDYSASLANELANDFDVTLIADKKNFTSNVDKYRADEFCKKGKISLFPQHKIWFRWASSFKIIAQIIAIKPDYVITHEHIHPHLTFAYDAISKISKLILIVHDPKPHTGRDALLVQKNQKQREKQRLIAYKWLVHGDFCKNLLSQMVPPERKGDIVSIPLGANFFPKEISPLKHTHKVLMFGRMEEYKGLDFLLEIAKKTYEMDKDIKFVIAGGGPEIDRLGQEFTNIGNCIVNSSFIPLEEAKTIIEESDMYIAPYSEATQSGVVSGAFAFGRPIIATKVGGLPDFVVDGYNGMLLEYGDTNGFCDAIIELKNDPEKLDKLAEGSAKTFYEKISWKAIAEKIKTSLLK